MAAPLAPKAANTANTSNSRHALRPFMMVTSTVAPIQICPPRRILPGEGWLNHDRLLTSLGISGTFFSFV
jgi:hypothetical protein